jgi:DNA modification methylase
MKPVVIGDATLYLGDCMEVLPLLDKVDAVITDPPYGINVAAKDRAKEKKAHYFKAYAVGDWDKERPSKAIFDAIQAAGDHQIIWGGNYFADLLPPRMGWLSWDKTQRGLGQADGELAWTSFNNAIRIFTANRVIFEQEGGRDHPTQKPIALMKWCIEYADRHGSARDVLDPFMGSGTTGVAAIQLGRRFIGIERDERYFGIACRRIEQAVAQGQLFALEPMKQTQEALL